jgi:tetratricopeptide (TPR) repeat protein
LRAQAAQGFLLMQGDPPDPATAERVLREVLAQDPNMSDALNWLQNTLHLQGRDDEARPILERAALIDPLHPSIAANLAARLIEEGRRDEAKRIFQRVLEQPAPGPMVYQAANDFYRSTGDLVELVAAQKLQAMRQLSFSSLFFLLQACAALGDWQMADAVNDRMLRVPPEGPGRIYRRMILPGLKGQTDATLQRIREAYAERGLSLADLNPFDRVVAGTHFARGGDYAAAIVALEPVVDIDSPYSSEVPNSSYSPAAHWLAWSYLRTDAGAKAPELLAAASRECSRELAEGRLRDSWNLHRCAEVELLRGDVEGALSGLTQAIEAGWREYYVKGRDPFWASVANNPRYRALMANVKADVDRQRAEVQRADAGEDFFAKLDAAIAAKFTPGQ